MRARAPRFYRLRADCRIWLSIALGLVSECCERWSVALVETHPEQARPPVNPEPGKMYLCEATSAGIHVIAPSEQEALDQFLLMDEKMRKAGI